MLHIERHLEDHMFLFAVSVNIIMFSYFQYFGVNVTVNFALNKPLSFIQDGRE